MLSHLIGVAMAYNTMIKHTVVVSESLSLLWYINSLRQSEKQSSPKRLLFDTLDVQTRSAHRIFGSRSSTLMFWSNVTYMVDADYLYTELYQYRTGKESNLFSGTGPPNRIRLSSMVKSTPGGNGTLAWHDCYLQEAVQMYPVTVTNNVIALRPMPIQHNFTK